MMLFSFLAHLSPHEERLDVPFHQKSNFSHEREQIIPLMTGATFGAVSSNHVTILNVDPLMTVPLIAIV